MPSQPARRRSLVPWIALGLVVLVAVNGLRRGPEQVPDVELLMLGGEKVTPVAYEGRPLVVTFWSITCPPCLGEIPHLEALTERYGPDGLEVIAVTMPYDPPADVARFAREQGLPYRVALDLDGAAGHAFGGVPGTPTTFLVAPDGSVDRRVVGPFPRLYFDERIAAWVGAAPAPRSGAS
jgi:thiol-disulfide isomerase/thioredoxin